MEKFVGILWKVLLVVLFTVGVIFMVVSAWLEGYLGISDLYGTIFSITQGGGGANIAPFYPIMVECSIIIIIIGGASTTLFVLFRNHKYKEWFYSFYIMITVTIFILGLVYADGKVSIYKIIKGQVVETKLFDDEYVDPNDVGITFPDGKRNLIYISIESMENTFSSKDYGGALDEDVIPELTALQLDKDNVNFTVNHDVLNGAYTPANTAWTAASQVAQTSGVPLKEYFSTERYLSGCVSIGDILKRHGYKQVYIAGSYMDYADEDQYYTQHGGYDIIDMKYAIESGMIPSDYYVNWGYEDEKVFKFAEGKLCELSKEQQPFNMFIATMDTHFPDGYKCRLCPSESDIQYENVLSCESSQLESFVEWVKEQDFYDNTTIVLSGDHPTMEEAYIRQKNVTDNYDRRTYVVIINSGKAYTLDYDRYFTVFDMYPTTLAAIGAEIEGDRLGLGISLFSDTPTLLEKYGYDKLNSELEKKSVYYNEKLK